MANGTPKTRSTDHCIYLLPETPGPEHLEIRGSRLPTYLQVLLCFKSHYEIERENDKTKNIKVTRLCAKKVVDVIVPIYAKLERLLYFHKKWQRRWKS